MKNLFPIAACLALTATSAVALDAGFVSQMQTTAQKLESDATAVQQALKNKKHDATEVKAKIAAMSADVAALHQLVKQFEATQPQLSGRDQQDWTLMKDRVAVLGIFHDNKQRLAAEDLGKHRGMVRAFADGVALRAKLLRESALKLQRAPVT
ncbi:MAG: hypothetical protein K2X03_23320 [Bryobacteraceae bacterium]|nr:hypothetical protein [Bryobacteraceae bacterium]